MGQTDAVLRALVAQVNNQNSAAYRVLGQNMPTRWDVWGAMVPHYSGIAPSIQPFAKLWTLDLSFLPDPVARGTHLGEFGDLLFAQADASWPSETRIYGIGPAGVEPMMFLTSNRTDLPTQQPINYPVAVSGW